MLYIFLMMFDDMWSRCRVYVLVVAMEPLRVYVYNEGLVRFATQKYTLASTAKNAHLTNFRHGSTFSDFEMLEEE